LDQPQSIGALLEQAVQTWGPRIALRRRREALKWSVLTWTELGQQVRALAAGLIDLGVRKGDRVALLAPTRLEWSLLDYAALTIGAVPVPIYHSQTTTQVLHVLKDSGASVLVVEGATLLEKVADRLDVLPDLKHLVVIEVMDLRGVPDAMLLDSLAQRGRRHLRESRGILDEAIADVSEDDLATIVYTSGTTGLGKGVRLTHRNVLAAIEALHSVMPVGVDDTTVLCLPLSHIYARMAQFSALSHGFCIAYARRVDLLSEVLQEIRPTFFFAVPRIFEKIYHQVVAGYRDLPPLLQAAVRRGINAAKEDAGIPVERSRRGGRLPGSKLGRKLADRGLQGVAGRTVFAPVRDALGGRVRFCVSGGAPLNVEVAGFFRMSGVEVLEGYGLTETMAAASINPLDDNRLGTVGRPLPGVRVRIAPDGEVLLHGDVIFEGYHNRPDETALILDDEGWLHTGDLGRIDDGGYLVITDRKKDLLITSGAKNVAPQRVEGALRMSPYIDDVMVFGDRRPYLVALITLVDGEVAKFAEGLELPTDDWSALLRDPRVASLIQAEIERCNGRLARFERVQRWRVLPRALSIAGGTLTPTLKVRRRAIAERNAPLIEAMYAELPPA